MRTTISHTQWKKELSWRSIPNPLIWPILSSRSNQRSRQWQIKTSISTLQRRKERKWVRTNRASSHQTTMCLPKYRLTCSRIAMICQIKGTVSKRIQRSWITRRCRSRYRSFQFLPRLPPSLEAIQRQSLWEVAMKKSADRSKADIRKTQDKHDRTYPKLLQQSALMKTVRIVRRSRATKLGIFA